VGINLHVRKCVVILSYNAMPSDCCF